MKNFKIVSLLAAATLALSGCGGKEQKTPFEYREVADADIITRDSTIYGICGDGSAMNTLQLLTDNGDTLRLSLTEAQSRGQCFGGIGVGDRMAVLQKEKGVARMVINLSTLMGNWVMPNPLDGSSEVGLRIKEGGIVEDIDQSTLSYKSWRIFNGQLELQLVREGGGDQEETLLYDLVSLGADSLVIKDAEDQLEYTRQQEHKENSKVKLEDSSSEDFLF